MKKRIVVALLAICLVALPIRMIALTVTTGDRMYISAENDQKTVNVGDTLQLAAVFIEAVSSDVTWESNNTTIASVDGNGKVTGVGTGSVVITATSLDKKYVDTYTIKVIRGNVSTGSRIYITGNEDKTTLNAGESINLYAQFLEMASKDVTWESSDSSVASVDSNGKVTALKKGMVAIRVMTTDRLWSDAVTFRVFEQETSTGAKIVIESKNNSQVVNVGENLGLVVKFLEMNEQSVNWSSSNTTILTVDANGVVYGVSEGSAVVSASTVDNKYTGSITIHVGKKMSVTTNDDQQGETDDSNSNVTTGEGNDTITTGDAPIVISPSVDNSKDNDSNFIADHKTVIIIVGISVLVILFGVLLFINYKNKKETK